jgi:hypothetical protein
MTDAEDKEKKTKMPYEPPRLFSLGGGTAHAAEQCQPGGSPLGGKCQNGAVAIGGNCQSGTIAGNQCKVGVTPVK